MKDNRLSIFTPRSIFADDFSDMFFGRSLAHLGGTRMEMYEQDGKYHIKLEAAGFKEDDIDISIEDNVLTVSGNVQEEQKEEDKNKKYYYSEMKQQSFSRSVTLPTKVKADEIEAEMKHGVLEITAPMAEEAAPRKIAVKRSEG